MASLKQNLQQQQRLQQRLTPMQVRFVRMLEMSAAEVDDEVRREMDENPALEAAEPQEESVTAQDSGFVPYYRYNQPQSSSDSDYEPVIVADDQTLHEYLSSQLREQELSADLLEMAEYIIGNIDNNGYLTRTSGQMINDMAINRGIDASQQQFATALDAVRALDPAGVGASDLRDCLLLQLRRMAPDADVEIARDIVAHYFDLFSKRHFQALMSALHIDSEQLRRATEVITGLNPKPGNAISVSRSVGPELPAIPDFMVEVDGERLTVSIPNGIPELRVEQSFLIDELPEPSVMDSAERKRDDRRRREALTFIRRRRDDAVAFIKLISMRQQTLMKVMRAIVSLQREFFIGGEDESLIRPMVLRDVAAITGQDLSVISRATTGKWVATSRGIYPLKLFFNEKFSSDTDASVHEIMAALRSIIDSEDKHAPLSDEAIAAQLREQGYPLARRTVAKYREKAGFPVGRLRKEI